MASTGQSNSGRRHDPYVGFAFLVEIGQQRVAGFSEVAGLLMESEVASLRVGGVNDHAWQLPGPARYPSRLTLKRGLGDVSYLWDWYAGVLQGRIERRDVAIHLNDRQGGELRSWTFRQACPVKWTGPDLRADVSAVAFETVELVHRGVAP